MRLPSLREFWIELNAVAERFPFALLSAIVGSAAMMVLMNDLAYARFWLQNTAAVGFLGVSLFFSLQLFAEQRQWGFGSTLALKLGGTALLVLYYYLLPVNLFESPAIHAVRYLLFLLALHLLAAFVPFVERGYREAFWEFNKVLFLSLVLSALYTVVLFAGFSIAILAVDQLFSVHVKPERYAQLWWFLTGVFNTWFFLSGVPRAQELESAGVQYPRGLKVFAQYILLPLVAVYLCILYVYMGKIIVQWDWPKGWVGYLVLGFSITGIFSLLLLHPIKDRPENRWMALTWKWFYAAVLPLVVLLLLAVWRRVSEYSITENRYFLIVLGVWLALTALYMLLSRTKNIKLIPASLCCLAVLVSFGPWGAFSVSQRCQMHRLEKVLTDSHLLVQGKAQKAVQKVSLQEAETICSLSRYMAEVHGAEVLQPWFNEPLDTLAGNIPKDRQKSRYYQSEEIVKRVASLLEIPYVNRWGTKSSNVKTFRFKNDSIAAVPLQGYRYELRNVTLSSTNQDVYVNVEGTLWHVQLETDSSRIVLHVPEGHRSAITLKEALASFYIHPPMEYASNSVPMALMQYTAESGGLKWKIIMQSVSVRESAEKKEITEITVDILVK